MKIVCIQYPGGNRVCITNTGQGIPSSLIDGEASVGRNLESVGDRYRVTSGVAEACET